MKRPSDFIKEKQELAKKYNLTLEQVNDITNHQFEWLADNIKNYRYPAFLLHGLGSYRTDAYKVRMEILKQIMFYKKYQFFDKETCIKKVTGLLNLRPKAPRYEWKESGVHSSV